SLLADAPATHSHLRLSLILQALIALFNHTHPTENYTLSLHDALPIYFFSDKLVLTSVTPASSAPVLQTPKATSSTLYFGVCKTGDRKSGSAGMPRPISYAVFCLKKKQQDLQTTQRIHCPTSMRHRATD